MAKLQFLLTGAIAPNIRHDNPGQSIVLGQFEDATVTCNLWDAADDTLDLTGGALVTNFRTIMPGSPTDGPIVFARQLDIDMMVGGVAHFDIVGSNGDLDDIMPARYVGDVYYIDPLGYQTRVIKPFRVVLTAAVTDPRGSVTPTPGSVPLGQGPAGLYSFRYTFTGTEGTDFTVVMPTALPGFVGPDYDVFATIVAADSWTSIQAPLAGRQADRFEVVLGVALAAGSVVEFGVARRVS